MGQLEKLFRSWGFSSLRTNCGEKYGIYMQIIVVYVFTYIAYVYSIAFFHFKFYKYPSFDYRVGYLDTVFPSFSSDNAIICLRKNISKIYHIPTGCFFYCSSPKFD